MRLALSASLALGLGLAAAPAFAAEWQPSATGQVYVDATVYHDAVPDQINMSVSCNMNTPGSKPVLRENIASTMKAVSDVVGGEGKVRRSGAPYFYEYYGDMGKTSDFTGSFELIVIDMNPSAADKVVDKLSDLGCTGTWDVRLTSSTKFARQYKAELLAQIKDKQELYEELLGIKLSRVSSVSISTSTDGYNYNSYNSFNPETGMMRAYTTMSVTFDLGTGAPAK